MTEQNINNPDLIGLLQKTNGDPQVETWLNTVIAESVEGKDLITEMLANQSSCSTYERIINYSNEVAETIFNTPQLYANFLQLMGRIHFPHDDINRHGE